MVFRVLQLSLGTSEDLDCSLFLALAPVMFVLLDRLKISEYRGTIGRRVISQWRIGRIPRTT